MIFSFGIRTLELSGVVIWIGINSGDKLRNFLKTLCVRRKSVRKTKTFIIDFVIISLQNFFLIEESAILIVIELFMGKSYDFIPHYGKVENFDVEILKEKVELTRKSFQP